MWLPLFDNTWMKKPISMPCPCGRGISYEQCCGPLHQGQPAAGQSFNGWLVELDTGD